MSTTSTDKMPQWLKEIMERGFKPDKIYTLPEGLFSYVRAGEDVIKTQPLKYIFTLEGLPGSGKTSLLNLCSKFSLECVNQILPEEPKEEKPIEYFFNSDELKTKQVNDSKHNVALLDRYYVSTLAYYWATDKLNNTDNYSKAFAWYQTSINSGKLTKPFTVFLIKTPLDKSYVRKNRAVDLMSRNVWLNPDFLNLCEEYNEYFYKDVEPHTNVIRIDGTLDLQDIYGTVTKHLQKYAKD